MEFLLAVIFLFSSAALPCEAYKDPVLTSSFRWSSTYDIAIKTPEDVLGPFGDGPGHSSLHWQTPSGEMHERAGVAPISYWAQNIAEVCSGNIDEQPATIYKVEHDGSVKLVAMMDHSPMGDSLVIDVPLRDKKSFNIEINELLSVIFVDNPSRIKLISISGDVSSRRVLLENEIGKKRLLQIGDFISNRSGCVESIGEDYFISKVRPRWYEQLDHSAATQFRFTITSSPE